MEPPPNVKKSLEILLEKASSIKNPKEFNKDKTFQEFVRPLFEILGWKFNQKENPEIIPIFKESKNKADFAFKINDLTKFFLAIAPFDSNIDDRKWIIPATTFAFNKGVTWVVLTNFKKFKVLNSEVKGKTPHQMQFFEISYNDLILKYDRLSYLSKKSLTLNILDNEAEYFERKLQKTPINEQLLNDLIDCRNILELNIKKLNVTKKLKQEEIDESVQKILNRFIFMRSCGDRGIEKKHLLENLREWEATKKEDLIDYLRKVFLYFQENYGGTLFSSHLCDTLKISNYILQEIIEGLYYSKEKSIAYDFSIIEADVLGEIYEQYLRILRSDDEEISPGLTHRKKQGIFYTPSFVVSYMVNMAFKALSNGKKIDVNKIRILDPACGSGSFLIKSYDFLYSHFQKTDRKFHQTMLAAEIEGGVYSKKLQIVKENLFGVDLDKVATEIIQLNLMLKLAEKKHQLPILQKNIRLGNSLIEDPKVDNYALKFDKAFPHILRNNSGFDLIIGNPPYVRQEKIVPIKPYLESNYEVYDGKADLYVYFFERAFKLLREGGAISFIVSNKWLKAGYGYNLRKFLSQYWIEEFIDFGDVQIFKGAITYPCILIMKKIKKQNPKIKVCLIKNDKFKPFETYVNQNQFYFNQKKLKDDSWNFVNPKEDKLLEKIEKKGISLGSYIGNNVYRGIVTGLNKAFVIDQTIRNQLISEDPRSTDVIKPFLIGKEVLRYSINSKNRYLIFTRRGVDINKYPAIKKYLQKFRKELTPITSPTQKIGRKTGTYECYEIKDNKTKKKHEFLLGERSHLKL